MTAPRVTILRAPCSRADHALHQGGVAPGAWPPNIGTFTTIPGDGRGGERRLASVGSATAAATSDTAGTRGGRRQYSRCVPGITSRS